MVYLRARVVEVLHQFQISSDFRRQCGNVFDE